MYVAIKHANISFWKDLSRRRKRCSVACPNYYMNIYQHNFQIWRLGSWSGNGQSWLSFFMVSILVGKSTTLTKLLSGGSIFVGTRTILTASSWLASWPGNVLFWLGFLVEVSILVGTRTVLTKLFHVEVIIMVVTRVILIAFPSFSKSLRYHLPIVLPSTLFSLRYWQRHNVNHQGRSFVRIPEVVGYNHGEEAKFFIRVFGCYVK